MFKLFISLLPLRKTTKSSPAVSYRGSNRTTTKRTTRKAVGQSSSVGIPFRDEGLLVKVGVSLGWAFCLLLFFRLVFADRGLVDYYAKSDLIIEKENAQNNLFNENKSLEIEIERLDSDRSFQKKTVRRHLGVIAKDEFLVLFAREVGRTKPTGFRR